MNVFFLSLISYLFGSIPFGYVIAKLRNIDIRKVGSGNIGATNVNRALGLRYGAVVAILDMGKGAIPTLIALELFNNQQYIASVAFAAFLGHIFPFYLKFKGGKGVATFAGTILVITGIKIFFIIAITWLTCLYLTKIMSLTNLILSVLIPFIFLIAIYSVPYFIYSMVVCIIIYWSHRKNIIRIRTGTEEKLRFPIMRF